MFEEYENDEFEMDDEMSQKKLSTQNNCIIV